ACAAFQQHGRRLGNAMQMWKSWLAVLTVGGLCSVGNVQNAQRGKPVTRAAFGNVAGTPVEVFTLTNARGVEIRAMTYGAIMTSIRVPHRKGGMASGAL